MGEALRRELLEHQIDFERDPAMRDISAAAPEPPRTPEAVTQEPAGEPPVQDMSVTDNHEDSGTDPQHDEAHAAYEAMRQPSPRPSSSSSMKTMVDILFIAVIAILALLVLIVYLKRS